jgi:Predicted membrane protein
LEEFVLRAIGSLQSFFCPELIVFIISMIPVLELRGGLIAASLLGIDWPIAVTLCVIGNLIPIPFVIIFIKKIFEYFKNIKSISPVIIKLEEKAQKSSEKIFKYEKLGLYFFVAIPLPGTGAWTGALVAALFGMKIKNVFLSMLLGLITAAVIMALFSYGLLKPLIF